MNQKHKDILNKVLNVKHKKQMDKIIRERKKNYQKDQYKLLAQTLI